MTLPLADRIGLERARAVARQSRDPKTQVGCVILHPDRGLVSEAANDFPAGLMISANSGRRLAPEKYKWIEHAERRAIYAAARDGVPTRGATLYLYGGEPCAECARGAIEAGIIRIVCAPDPSKTGHWRQSYEVSRAMLAECAIALETWPIAER
jgi:dCMP deaminase